MLFTFAVAAASALAVAVIPAWRLSRVDAMSILRQSGRGVRGRRVGGRALVAVEAALSVLLVTAAAATGRSLVALEHVELGFVPQDLYRLNVTFPPLTDAGQRFDRFTNPLRVVRWLPGVRQAAGTNDSFLGGGSGWAAFGKGFERRGARSNVTAGYFETVGPRVLAGGRSRRPRSPIA